MRQTKNVGSTVVIRTNTVNEDGANYKYKLYMQQSGNVASYKLPLYSIGIEMTDRDGNYTEARVADVFSDIGKALVFYERLVSNLATPLNLPYILEDEMC